MSENFNPLEEIDRILYKTKEDICNILVSIYQYNNNGLLPNWEEELEVVVPTDETIGTFVIYVDEHNTYDENSLIMPHKITDLIVTLDYCLYLHDENGNDYEWNEINIDELITLHTKIHKFISKFK